MESLASSFNLDAEIVALSHRYTVRDCISFKHANFDVLRSAYGSRAVLLRGAPDFTLFAFIVLDGIADKILIAPSDACFMFFDRARNALEGLVEACAESSVFERYAEGSLDAPPATATTPEWFRGIKTEYLLATSGTTSTPKIVSHSADSLSPPVSKRAKEASYNWGLLYEFARFAGIQVAIQALRDRGKLLIAEPSQTLGERVNWLAQHGCDALSCTPTLWRKILMTPSSSELRLRQVSMGGEIADKMTLKAVASRFPDAHITHIYASTEAGVGFAVHDGGAGFPASWLQDSSRSVQMKLGDSGTLLVRPKSNDQRYHGADEFIFQEDGWIDTGDCIEVRGDRCFFLGRDNGSINVGGNKVFPDEIEAVLRSIPGVADAAVYARGSSMAGALVAADVVADSGTEISELKKQIKAYCKESMPSYKRPALLSFVDELQITAAGKKKRVGAKV